VRPYVPAHPRLVPCTVIGPKTRGHVFRWSTRECSVCGLSIAKTSARGGFAIFVRGDCPTEAEWITFSGFPEARASETALT